MRDLLVFGVVMIILPMAFRRPFVGLLLFSWLAYMRPQDMCWGFARHMRFSFFVALVMLVGWWVHESQARRFWRVDARTAVMALLVVWVTISLSMADNWLGDEYVTRYYLEFVKIIVIAAFTTGQVDTKERLRTLLWTIALCLGFFGIKGGLFGLLTGGQPILRGPGGMLEDNNDFALALVMNIPLLFYLGRSEKVLWIRRAADIGIAMSLITILLTHSRGAFLSVCGIMLIMSWRARRLWQATFMLAFLASLFFLFAPEHVKERILTIGQGTEESSAHARIKAWTAAMRMVGDNPVFGVGLRNFRGHYERHHSGILGEDPAQVAHNSYLQIWAEGGSVTFVTYLILLILVFTACRWLRNLARYRPHLEWVGVYSRMFEATTFGFMVGATFLNRGHFDLIYHWIALVSCTVYIARVEALRGPEASGAAAAVTQQGLEVRWRPVGSTNLLPRWGR